MALIAYGVPLEPVTSFTYLGQALTVEENDWRAMVCNIQHARKKWEQLPRYLSREGADARNSGQIYLAVLQLVILYGSETRVLTPRMKRVVGRFHHRVANRLTGRQLWRGRDGGWVYPLLEDAMQWRRQDCRRWRLTSPAAITQ